MTATVRRHYVALLDVDTIGPENTKLVDETSKALMGDAACFLAYSMWEAFHLSRAGFPIVFIKFGRPAARGISIGRIMPTSETAYVTEVYAFPWPAVARDVPKYARMALDEAYRVHLHPAK